mmetsp:Transcript_26077/g.34227  ORF Transcript_26077/g.34227 Transcript_26077/m.34227 type:complete len:130 (+) Transcript_26077:194-583(+)
MANIGVFQMKKLTLYYCPKGGSSRGIREAISKFLVDFASQHPEAQYKAATRPGKHPYLLAEYLKGYPQQIGVKNKTAEEVMAHVNQLRNRSGRKITKISKPVFSNRPSLQGQWNSQLPIFQKSFELEHK